MLDSVARVLYSKLHALCLTFGRLRRRKVLLSGVIVSEFLKIYLHCLFLSQTKKILPWNVVFWKCLCYWAVIVICKVTATLGRMFSHYLDCMWLSKKNYMWVVDWSCRSIWTTSLPAAMCGMICLPVVLANVIYVTGKKVSCSILFLFNFCSLFVPLGYEVSSEFIHSNLFGIVSKPYVFYFEI